MRSARVRRALQFGGFLIVAAPSAVRAAAECSAPAYTSERLAQMTMEELLDLEHCVSVASRTMEPAREARGAVLILTRRDIEENHCRDLVDVLQMVPGFNITRDLGPVSASFRGLYAFEGRALFMLDGMPLNELSFGSFALGDNIPVNLIERIEISRGPGSVIYGGAAELAVINIVTGRGADLQGARAVASVGLLPTGAAGHVDVGLATGAGDGDLEWSLGAWYRDALGSDGRYRAFGWTPEFTQNDATAGTRTTFLAGQLRVGALRLKGLLHHQQTREVTAMPGLEAESPEGYVDAYRSRTEFLLVDGHVSYTIPILDALHVVPALAYQLSQPWRTTPLGTSAPDFSSLTTHRLRPWVHGMLALGPVEITAGGELFWDFASAHRARGADDAFRASPSGPPRDHIAIRNQSIFGDLKWRVVDDDALDARLNLYAGLRYDDNELYGHYLSPRAAGTFLFRGFHAKLIASGAFRAPLVANTAFSAFGIDPEKPWRTPVEPETINVYELELGQRISRSVFATLNAFHQVVHDMIVYRFNPDELDSYSSNSGKLGSYGAEAEVRVRTGIYGGLLSGSFFTPRFFADPDNTFAYAAEPRGGDPYIAPDVDESGTPRHLTLLGVPRLKIYTSHSVELSSTLSLQASAYYLSKKRAMADYGVTRALPQEVVVGAGFIYRRLFDQPVTLRLSIHDLFNRRPKIAVPFYDSGWPDLAYKGREFSLTLTYEG